MFLRMGFSACHDGRLRQGDRRFVVALGVSLLLHAAVLHSWRQQQVLIKPVGYGALTVSFGKSLKQEIVATQLRPPATVRQKEDRPLMLQVAESPVHIKPGKSLVVSPTADSRGSTLEKTLSGQDANASSRQLSAGLPRAGVRRNSGNVSVLIVMGEEGRPGQIIWGELPAMNAEQLKMIESHVRSRIYANVSQGVRLMEEIDIHALLRQEVGADRKAEH